jgi:hypothetical protein
MHKKIQGKTAQPFSPHDVNLSVFCVQNSGGGWTRTSDAADIKIKPFSNKLNFDCKMFDRELFI